MLVRERINKWTEDSGLLGEVHGSFRRGRRTEGSLFILERLTVIVMVRKEDIFVTFVDKEKNILLSKQEVTV